MTQSMGDERDAAKVERTDGRPGDAGPATPDDAGRPSVVRVNTSGTGSEPGAHDTVAPEEQGEHPETEHAPGSDL